MAAPAATITAPTGTAPAAVTADPSAPENVWMFLMASMVESSNTAMKGADAQADSVEFFAEVEVKESENEITTLTNDNDQLQKDINIDNNNTKSKDDTKDQNAITEDNTQFSVDQQAGSINISTVNNLVQQAQSASEGYTNALNSISSIFSAIQQVVSTLTSLIR